MLGNSARGNGGVLVGGGAVYALPVYFLYTSGGGCGGKGNNISDEGESVGVVERCLCRGDSFFVGVAARTDMTLKYYDFIVVLLKEFGILIPNLSPLLPPPKKLYKVPKILLRNWNGESFNLILFSFTFIDLFFPYFSNT